jgi:hypothetical protein
MRGLSRYRIMATLLFGLLLGLKTQTLASADRAPATADHTKFEALKAPFNSAPEVTAAWVLIVLWLFAIFWHITTGEWRQYIPNLVPLPVPATPIAKPEKPSTTR